VLKTIRHQQVPAQAAAVAVVVAKPQQPQRDQRLQQVAETDRRRDCSRDSTKTAMIC